MNTGGSIEAYIILVTRMKDPSNEGFKSDLIVKKKAECEHDVQNPKSQGMQHGDGPNIVAHH
jgi:hypothetical protein